MRSPDAAARSAAPDPAPAPRRRAVALLRGAGLTVEALPARVDEAEIKAAARADGASPEDTALLLAELKAARIARREPAALW